MIFEYLLEHGLGQPETVAVIDDAGQTTYQQLARMAEGLGTHLAAATSRPRVGLLLPAGAGYVASFYGALSAGKTVVPINFLLGDREIKHILSDSGIDTVVTIPALASRVAGAGLNVVDLAAVLQSLPPASAQRPTRTPDDTAVLLYTSGTSGLPKGVMLTYGNLQSNVDGSIRHMRLRPDHRYLGVIPLFHSFGIMAMMLAPVQQGSTIIYMARFSPVAAVKALREHRASLILGVPSMYAAIANLKSATREDFGSVYAAISGGEPLPARVREQVRSRFGVELLEAYGLTETSPAVTFNTPDDHRAGSVGRPLSGVTVRIAGEDGGALPPGQVGEVWVRGPMVMKGYYDLPRETAEVLTADGFFKTGDLGRLDADGYLWITGRKKEMIIVSGEKAFPREIEEVLARHPGVAEAAVVGKKDASRGEVVVAFVTPAGENPPKPEELRDFCRAEGLVTWKVPREVFVVAELPRSPTGKVLKRLLVEKLEGAAGAVPPVAAAAN